MSIAFLTSTLGRGGSERVLSIIANKFSSKGYKVYIFTLHDSQPTYFINENITLKSLGIPRDSFNILQRIKAIASAINKYKISHTIALCSDVINATVILSKILFRFDSKIISTIRSNPLKKRSFLLRNLIFFFYKYADHIVVQTNFMYSYARLFSKKNNIYIIPNPLEDIFFENPFLVKKNKKFDLLAVGRINKLKNHSQLIEALNILVNKYNMNLKLCIVGRDDGALINLKKKIDSFGLKKNIYFSGEVDKVDSFYLNSKIFLHVSFYEGMPNVILESKKYGLPIIVSKFDGSSEMISKNIDGIILKDFSAEELSLQIKKLYNEPKRIRLLSDNAFQTSKKYGIDNIFKQWEKLL